MRVFAFCAIVLIAAAPAVASDAFFLTMQGDRAHEVSGAGGSIAWNHSFSSRQEIAAGFSSYHLGESDWHFVGLGYLTRLPARITLNLSGDLGRGSDPAHGFTYRIARGELSYGLVPSYVGVGLQVQKIAVDRVRGTVWKPSMTANVARFADITAAYYKSTGGNLHESARSIRIDAGRGRHRVLAGASTGTTTLDPQRPVELASAVRSQELFAGFTFAPGSSFVVSRLQLLNALRYTALMSWKFGR
jgi:hypothetical protein